MTDSPKQVYLEQMCDVYNECGARFVDCVTEVIDEHPFTPAETAASGVVKYRMEQRTSRDGRCTALLDIYTRDDGSEVDIVFSLELDGREYLLIRDTPHSVGDEL